MAEEHDSWMSGLGVDVQSLRDAASSAASAVGDAVSSVAPAASDGGGSSVFQETTASGAAPYVGSASSSGGGGGGDSSGGFLSGIANAVSDVASGAVNTVENVASDVGHAVSDAASGAINTVETAASGIEKTAVDASSGLWNTAKTVGGDIASGNFGDALGDAEKGVVSTTGGVVSDVAHTVVDTASAGLDATAKGLIDTQQGVADVAKGAISTAGHVVGDVANTVSNVAGRDSAIGRAASAVGGIATAATDTAVSAVNTAADFDKGLVEGVAGGVEGMAKGLVNLGDSAGREAYALATDSNARAQALNTVVQDAEAVGEFEQTLITDPSTALNQVGGAIESGATTVGNMAEGVYKQYQQAAAAGHGAEFIGKGLGQAAVVVAGAVLTDGAGLAGEGAAVAGEGAALVGEGAAIAGEGAALGGEVAGGVTTAEELGTAATQLAGRGATTAEELGTAATQVAGRGGTTAEELGTATTQLADRGASAAEELADGPTAIPGADPGPLPARFQGPSQPIKLFDTELQPIEPGSPNLTATPKASEPIRFELGDERPPGQVQLGPGDGSPVADPLAQTREMPAFTNEGGTTGAGVGGTPRPNPFADLTNEEIDQAVERMEPAGDLIELGPHRAASANREALGVSGQDVQSAHDMPQAIGRANVADYNPNDALTRLMPRADHAEMDAGWKDGFQDMRRAGRTQALGQEVFDTVAESIRDAQNVPPGERESLVARLSDEMFTESGLRPEQNLDLPYPNVKAQGTGVRIATDGMEDLVRPADLPEGVTDPGAKVRIDASPSRVASEPKATELAQAEAEAEAEVERTQGLPPQRRR
jgi:hypothetical protein